MTNLREKARQIYAEGAEERGNYSPEAGSVPLRLYQYWASRSDHVPARENFCHYWRVVLFWAPMLWLWEKKILQVLVAVGYIAAAVILLSISGLRGLGIGLVLAVVVVIGGALIFLAVDKWWNRSWNKSLGKILARAWFGLLAIAAGGYLLFAFWMGLSEFGWMFLVYVLLGLLAAAAVLSLIYGAITLVERSRSRRRAREREETLNPRRAAVEKVKRPSRVKRVLSGIGDFLILLGQVVRVKKWKICPIVTIPTDEGTDRP